MLSLQSGALEAGGSPSISKVTEEAEQAPSSCQSTKKTQDLRVLLGHECENPCPACSAPALRDTWAPLPGPLILMVADPGSDC